MQNLHGLMIAYLSYEEGGMFEAIALGSNKLVVGRADSPQTLDWLCERAGYHCYLTLDRAAEAGVYAARLRKVEKDSKGCCLKCGNLVYAKTGGE